MRVTQSMLTSNLLHNLNASYAKMAKYQSQIDTGKKIVRPSDNPVIAVTGMEYRTSLERVEQFKRNAGEAVNWLDTTDATLGQVGEALNRVKELVIQAANDTNNSTDREKIKAEIEQIREHFRDLGNTQVAEKYLFTGTNTQKPLYVDVQYFDNEAIQKHFDTLQKNLADATTGGDPLEIADAQQALDDFDTAANDADQTVFQTYLENQNIPLKTGRVVNGTYYDKDNNLVNPFDSFKDMELSDGRTLPLFNEPSMPTLTAHGEEVKIEVFENIQITVNAKGFDIFNRIDQFMEQVSEALRAGSDTNNSTDISDLLGGLINIDDPSAKGTDFSDIQEELLAVRAEIGARQNRIELMENRLDLHKVNITKQLSDNEDVDYALAITEMVTAESIHQAALSVGARIIQQTLVDFMR